MSGHNPHGRLGQPVNSSQWNHLQVPSYVPRQPQLAHMSNERSIRSPLAWHHAPNNSAEALYGYMAAAAAAAAASSSNHKTTPLDINPLLPFVRSASNPMPFGSVDLSISSGTRNSMTPSPRSQISPAATNATPSTSTNAQHESNMPSQESLAIFAEMSEQLAAMKANSALAANLFARELQQQPPANFSLNSDIPRPPSNHETPMELIKESNFNENDSFSAAALHQLFSANSPNVPQNLNELSKSLLTLINNTSTSNAPLASASTHHHSTNSDMTKSSASTSNDESVDSQTCNGDEGSTKRTRCRRRKPQKTIRMGNEASPPNLANGKSIDNNGRSHQLPDKPLEDSLQTQSMDLSNHSAGHDTFANGKLTNSIYSSSTAAGAAASKPVNGFSTMNMTHYPDPLSSMASASNHLKSAFNTDDLVKKVEEIVKCNSNDAPTPTNFPAMRNGDEHKGFIGQLSNGGDKNGIVPQPATDDYSSAETRQKVNSENGLDLMTSHETDAKKSKNELDEAPLLPNAEVKLPDLSLPVANSTPKRDHNDEVDNHSEKMYSHIDNVTASTTPATTTTNGVAEDTTQNDSENQNSQTNNETNNDSEIAAKSTDEQGTSSAAATASTSQSKPARTRKRPAANGKKRGTSAARRPNKSNSKGGSSGKNAAKNSNASKSSKNGKSNRNGEKADSKKAKEEVAAAEPAVKFRGPYIQIQKDGSECIVNAPITEEVIEKLNKNRKLVVPSTSSARSKVSGLHVSTLSTKYDAITTDASWMCVFCKMGPHKYGMGDLFGPFILSVGSEEFQESQFDPSEDVFRSHRTNADMVQVKGGMKVVPAKASTSSAATSNNAGNSSCRKKRKLTEPSTSTAMPSIVVPDIFHGMTKVSETAFEAWVHEDCIVWADGVYLIGARIVGLDAAIWSSSRHKCSICEQYGAVVTCLERGCKVEAHAPCAKRAQWSLNEANFQTHCKLHATADGDSPDTADEERH